MTLLTEIESETALPSPPTNLPTSTISCFMMSRVVHHRVILPTTILFIAIIISCLVAQGVQALSTQAAEQQICSKCPSYDDRTIWNIIWSCTATIFSCIWVALHPTIPSRGEGWFTITLCHMKLMGLALMVPELIVAFAMRQRINASKLILLPGF